MNNKTLIDKIVELEERIENLDDDVGTEKESRMFQLIQDIRFEVEELIENR